MESAPRKLPVGISSCLLGAEVRFDGGHKRDPWINTCLSEFVEFRPFCPEVAIGLGIPRQPVRLVATAAGIRVRGVRDTTLDVTQPLHDYGRETARQLDGLCGYIFKSRSPSCGMARVKTYTEGGMPARADASGAYAGEVMRAHPNLPVEEEGRLRDPGLRANFVERIFTRSRWRQLLAEGITPARLIEFHSRHKLAVMVHNQAAYQRLGQRLANIDRRRLAELAAEYETELMQALQRQASRKSHCNILQHLQGFFSKQLSAGDRAELTGLIEEYRRGLVPLVAPLTLIRHHFRHHPNEWALQQTYLDPYPQALM